MQKDATIDQLTEEQVRALDNLAWAEADLELQWLCQTELMRRKREIEETTTPD